MRKLVLLFISFVCATFVSAQKVSNVRHWQNGEDIVVSYSLDNKANYVELYVSTDGGSSFFQIHPMYLSGEQWNVPANNNKILTWHVLKQYETFKFDSVCFKVEAKNYDYSKEFPRDSPGPRFKDWNWSQDGRSHALILADFTWSAQPQMSGGIMIGGVRRWGGYGKIHTSFTKHRSHYSGVDYVPLIGSDLNYTGYQSNFELNITGGAIAPIYSILYAYFGVGFGTRELYWEYDSGWKIIREASYIGFSGDLGLLLDLMGIQIKCGVNTINFQYVELDVGLGYKF